MDGFEKSDSIVVLAATNRADILDSALTRSGRFDRKVQVGLPNTTGRRKILDVHLFIPAKMPFWHFYGILVDYCHFGTFHRSIISYDVSLPTAGAIMRAQIHRVRYQSICRFAQRECC